MTGSYPHSWFESTHQSRAVSSCTCSMRFYCCSCFHSHWEIMCHSGYIRQQLVVYTAPGNPGKGRLYGATFKNRPLIYLLKIMATFDCVRHSLRAWCCWWFFVCFIRWELDPYSHALSSYHILKTKIIWPKSEVTSGWSQSQAWWYLLPLENLLLGVLSGKSSHQALCPGWTALPEAPVQPFQCMKASGALLYAPPPKLFLT